MKLAIQEGLLPGTTLSERAASAAKLGFEGIEFWGDRIGERVGEIRSALAGTGVRASTTCAGYPGTLVTADPVQRQACREGILERLRVAAELEMVGLIVVPAFNDWRNIPDLSPYRTQTELEDDLLIAQLQEMAPEIEKLGGPCILLEPLNRYEAGYLAHQARAGELARRVGSPAVAVMSDLFHMNIEETDTPGALRELGPLCRHVHLADNTRLEPGTGTIDFKAAFDALREIKFDGYMALECGLSGEAESALPRCVEYLRSCM